MNSGQILIAAPYEELLASSPEFQDRINVHDDTARFETQVEVEQASTGKHKLATEEIEKVNTKLPLKESSGDQLIKQEERETGDTGFKPYIQYLKPSKGFLYFSVCILLYSMFIVGQLIQYYWLASNLQDSSMSTSAFAITLIRFKASSSGFIGMILSYGLSLNVFVVIAVQYQCILANAIISVERVEQYMHIPSEAPEVIEDNRPAHEWATIGKVEILDLKVRYRPNAPLVLHGINCTIEGGDKIGIVGRTGSGKTTLISVMFHLVEPTERKVIVDDYDICTIGLHDLRSRFGIIPLDPTLFSGSVRFNLDPLSRHTDNQIWAVLDKCWLREAIQEKEDGLDSLATASMDNTTDSILQKTIRTEFEDCTVITVAHKIPTVMDCTKVLAISDGRLVEYDEPTTLMKNEGLLFGQLVKEYWSRVANADIHSEDRIN
ncbi:hypothetical protein C1H46_027575 [Malus baccata]|uniref:ABC transporter domain-containing protein n=1 Tax=Malus baccata TaxID=106549 RepID=A0A540LK97_MALBA|nr:hypothetical protein C1H46_027575 [Malus baccata]